MTTAHPFPQPDPSAPGPTADSAPSGAAAGRDADLREVDEISAIALALLRALHGETMDPWNSPTCLPGERVRAGDPPLAYCRLTRTIRVNLAVRARMVAGSAEEAGAPGAMARQDQIRVLVESSSIGMDLLRALHQEVVDPDNAPTARQGRRVGAGDPALALSRISRAIRLNHAIKARIAEGSLGRRRQSQRRDPVDQDTATAAPPPGPRPVGAPNSAAEERRGNAEPDDEGIETDGIETETEDLFAELDEDFEDQDEFAGLDGLSPEERMALVRRDFARCFTGKARVPGTAAPGEPPARDEPSGRNESPGPGGGETADPPSIRTKGHPAELRTLLQRGTATGTPGRSSSEAPTESPSAPDARGHDPPRGA
jgi:hypothetical protein